MPEQVASTTLKRHSFVKGPGFKVTAAVGVPGTSGEIPEFLKGPDLAVRAVRHGAEEARKALAQLLATLQVKLPEAAAKLKAVEDVEGGVEIAAGEGFDAVKARELVDKLTGLLQGLK
jgi:hypothetical protein